MWTLRTVCVEKFEIYAFLICKIPVGGKFAQQAVVNPAAFQKHNHFITQMQFC